MKGPRLLLLLGLVFTAALFALERSVRTPLVIAHRGASGYLPEHTLESAAYAHALGADFIEQDVVLSKDDVLVVLHDIHLDTVTDVAKRFPERKRADGRFYAIDFTWEELASLVVRERFDPRTGAPVFPHRFPAGPNRFRLCTFEEQVALIDGLNRSTGRTTGIYVEYKDPAFHAQAGKDIGALLIATLARHGYTRRDQPVFVQCFDGTALEKLRAATRSELRFIRLLEANDDTSETALRKIATYAQGIGPSLGQVFSTKGNGKPEATSLVRQAHTAGLLVHPYTVRADALPPGFHQVDELVEQLLKAGVDGFFIDQTDVGRRGVDRTP